MRIAECVPGVVAYKGRPEQRATGTGAEKVIVLAVGDYTETWAQGCPGVAVKPFERRDNVTYAGRSKPRVVIARQTNHWTGGVKEQIWRPEVTTQNQLIAADEYEVKAKAARKVEAASRKHAAEGDRILKEIERVVRPFMPQLLGPNAKITVVYHNWRRDPGMNVICPDISLTNKTIQARLPKAARTKLVRLLKEHEAWRAIKDPGSC